jgi:hypothetical protein
MHTNTGTGGVVVEIPTAAAFAQVVIKPIGSPSGTGTLTARPSGGEEFHAVNDADGNPITDIDLSAESVRTISSAKLTAIKVVSSNSADVFTVNVVT